MVLERAHAIVDESIDASSVISSDRVIKTLIFQKTDVVMMTVADVNLDYAIVGMLLIVTLNSIFMLVFVLFRCLEQLFESISNHVVIAVIKDAHCFTCCSITPVL